MAYDLGIAHPTGSSALLFTIHSGVIGLLTLILRKRICFLHVKWPHPMQAAAAAAREAETVRQAAKLLEERLAPLPGPCLVVPGGFERARVCTLNNILDRIYCSVWAEPEFQRSSRALRGSLQ